MCYIMISRKINNNRDAGLEAQLKALALGQAKDNPHGFFLEAPGVNLRTMDAVAFEAAVKAADFSNAQLHCRYATCGKVDESNVHGWQLGPWKFMHNGVVRDYQPKQPIGFTTTPATPQPAAPEQQESDSLMLFHDIVDTIQLTGLSDKKILQAIRQAINAVDFWGRAVLWNTETDKAYLFGDWQVYLIAESYLLFSSKMLDFEREIAMKTHGISFTRNHNPVSEHCFDGIGIIKHFTAPNFHFKYRGVLELPQPETKYNWNGYGWQSETAAMEEDAELDAKYGACEDADTPEYEDDGDFWAYVYEAYGAYGVEPFEVETITNENGTHDTLGICCEAKVCEIFNTLVYQDTMEANRQEQLALNLA